MSDEGIHEIQLSGKQLFFLFMASTVVLVVVFLCGVLVGRGVRAERVASAEAVAGQVAEVAPDAAPGTTREAPPAAAVDPATPAPPTPAEDDLTSYNRLESAGTPRETLTDEKPLKPSAAAPRPAAAAPPPPAPPPAAPAPAPAAAAAAPPPAVPAVTKPATAAEPPGSGYAVQVAAVKDRSEADGMVARLSGKGYQAYVVSGGPAAARYRVRVGKFKTRGEAEEIARKLEKNEQFKPWILR